MNSKLIIMIIVVSTTTTTTTTTVVNYYYLTKVISANLKKVLWYIAFLTDYE